MSGVVITTEIDGLDRLNARLDRLARPALPKLLHQLVAEGESQTRRRIESERRGPDGEAWPEWSESYAAGRHHGHSLLIAQGHLLDSIIGYVDTGLGFALGAGWGSNRVYAALHQFGGTPGMKPGPRAVPARPFLGISPENEEALLAIVDAYVDRLLSD